eukprot:scaffold119632_cov51-Phaeocystis_antarctica.AAC.1
MRARNLLRAVHDPSSASQWAHHLRLRSLRRAKSGRRTHSPRRRPASLDKDAVVPAGAGARGQPLRERRCVLAGQAWERRCRGGGGSAGGAGSRGGGGRGGGPALSHRRAGARDGARGRDGAPSVRLHGLHVSHLDHPTCKPYQHRPQRLRRLHLPCANRPARRHHQHRRRRFHGLPLPRTDQPT